MLLIDTHTHLYDESFSEDIDSVVENAINAGVKYMLLPNCDIQTIEPMNALSEKYPEHIFPMLGLHPCYVKSDYKQQLNQILEFQDAQHYVAIGEIGLDYYWDKTHIAEQKDAFNIQIQWSLDKKLPIVIHTRDSIDDGIEMVSENQKGELSGVFHCFSGTETQAQKIIDQGFLLGIGGVVTFKNSTLKNFLKNIPLEHIILETDAPYLAPVPHRGKRNESANVSLVAETLSNIYEMPVDDIANITSDNALKLFNLK